MSTIRRLSDRALGRALLARQCLLERVPAAVTDTLEHVVAIQAQEPQAPYLALWSRLEAFEPGELSELLAARRVVRGSLMRCTVHLVLERDWRVLWPLMAPVLERNLRASPFGKALRGVDARALVARACQHMLRAPYTRPELGQLLAADWPSFDAVSLGYGATLLCSVVQVPPRGLWQRSGQARWTLAETWLAQPLEPRPSLAPLVLRYLAAFGPASVMDIQAWSGLTRLASTVEALRDRLAVYSDERGREPFDLPNAPLPDPEIPAPPRILAPFDNVLLAHADRSRIVSASNRVLISRDRLMRTFLVDGLVAGTWALRGVTLELAPFARLSALHVRELCAEGERLLDFMHADAARRRVVLL